MGNMGAQMMGMELAPNTLEESTIKTIALVSAVSLDTDSWLTRHKADNATREKTSGKFFDIINNAELPW